jgi:hypothetical protein
MPTEPKTIMVAGRTFSTWMTLKQRIFASVREPRDQVIDYRFPGEVLIDQHNCLGGNSRRIEHLDAGDTEMVRRFFEGLQR